MRRAASKKIAVMRCISAFLINKTRISAAMQERIRFQLNLHFVNDFIFLSRYIFRYRPKKYLNIIHRNLQFQQN